MTQVPMDRRGFLLAGGAAIGATALSAWPIRAFGQAATPKVGGSFIVACCTGSGSWGDLSPAAVGNVLRDWHTFESVSDSEPGAKIDGPAVLGILAATVGKGSGLDRMQLEVDFTHTDIGADPRLFLAIVARADDSPPGGVACRVPADAKGARLRLTSEAAGKDPVVQDLRLPLRRGVYMLGWSADGRASGRVRSNAGRIESDWAGALLISVSPPSSPTTDGTK